MTNIIGTDVSFYQDNPATPQTIDFDAMVSGGAVFTIIRAGQNTWGDRDFKVNWNNAKGKLPRGSYWFYDSRIDPKVQAEKWLSMFDGNDFGELPLWCDFEDNYNGPFKGWKQWYNFIVHVQTIFPENTRIGIYTGYYYWKENTRSVGIPSASLEYFKQFPLWIANYGAASPLVPEPWDTWDLWQFTDNGDGTKYGVESLNIDLNYFNGTKEEFYDRLVIGLPSPEPEEPEVPEEPEEGDLTMRYEYINTVGNMSIRPEPTTSNVPIGTLDRGVKGLGNEIRDLPNGDRWVKILEGGNAVGWVAVKHLGKPYGTLIDNGVPPTPPVTEFPEEMTVIINGVSKVFRLVQ